MTSISKITGKQTAADLYFFLGKGGVGKTTISSAYAMQLATQKPAASVLLLSSDPAHSLSDVFDRPVSSHKARRIALPGQGKLYGWQLDAEGRFRSFVNENRNSLLSVLESASIFSREDIAPLLDTTLPGMSEVSALLAIADALESGKYQHIIVDTAPFGHTLRLLELPDYFSRFVDFLELASSRDRVLAAHFGGRKAPQGSAFLSDWRNRVDTVREAIQSTARLYLVTTPEKFSLNEAVRSVDELQMQLPGIAISAVILNRAVAFPGNCKICRSKRRMSRAARVMLKTSFPQAKLYSAEDTGAPITGVAGLKMFGNHIFFKKPLNWRPKTSRAREVRFVRTAWPVLNAPLSLVVGKGGVGKTTVSAALGFHTRAEGRVPVEVCSVDPAPSLDDVFQTKVTDRSKAVLGDPQFRASELDAPRLFKAWAEQMKDLIGESFGAQTEGVHVDFGFERQLFLQLLDSMPPGLDEIFAVIQIMDLLSDKTTSIIIDMAPTGHALELLRTPDRIAAWSRLLLKTLAAHRRLTIVHDLSVKVAELGKRVREISTFIKDSTNTQIYAVMLPERLPDLETRRLISDLEKLQLTPCAIFVNRILFPEGSANCARCKLARQAQLRTLGNLKKRYRVANIYGIRQFPEEITGKRALQAFTKELWSLA